MSSACVFPSPACLLPPRKARARGCAQVYTVMAGSRTAVVRILAGHVYWLNNTGARSYLSWYNKHHPLATAVAPVGKAASRISGLWPKNVADLVKVDAISASPGWHHPGHALIYRSGTQTITSRASLEARRVEEGGGKDGTLGPPANKPGVSAMMRNK
ncbi:hypothetical protein MRX96_032610 [Rhipicephalus microplus]